VNASIVVSTGPLRIGGNLIWGEYFNGLLDEIRVYNRVLTAGEVVTDMNTPVGGAPPPDTTPPSRSNGQPSGTLAAGTTSTTLQLTTNEAATCRFSLTAGTTYAAMTGTFATTGGTAHSTPVGGLRNGNTYTFYVRCSDATGNANTTDFPISFSIATPTADTTPPTRTNGQPTGTLPAGTTSATLRLTTDEAATCRYAVNASTAYATMPNVFLTTGGTAHASLVSGLANGTTYSYFVRCSDVVGNVNASDFPISFAVASGTSSLVAAFGFNEVSGTAVQDASGRGNGGTMTNVTRTTAGRYGGALVFNGTNAWVTVADSASLDLTNGMTLEAWVRPTAAMSKSWRSILLKERVNGLSYSLYANTSASPEVCRRGPSLGDPARLDRNAMR
jgi:concanavalin A-like lectin/glucanase superfamily protein